MNLPSAFSPLPCPDDATGQPRRVGVEVEFTGLSERRAAGVLAGHLGGRVEEEDPFAFHLVGSALGRISIERDLRHIHPHRPYRHPAPWLRPPVSTLVGACLGAIVPREMVTEPLPREALPQVDAVLDALRTAGARGDGATLAGSLGLHLNIAPPDHRVETLLALLRAYLLREEALRADILRGALVRFHAPEPFPAAYRRQVLDPSYAPDLGGLCEDYLAANPTRKRGLDLLPLFLELLGDRVAPRITDKVKPRPVLHYRLPVAHVGVAGWSLAADWNRWVAVERLAGDAPALAREGARAALRVADGPEP
ncbi:amidoligase family protein [Ancylobacter radicis]|uniref:Amidoligase family protein n=1 Tax=Ancylobacter radicis TaxID=2836179 RepID=A0ABS5RA06_9HYPH|nr:amidoligase family protein [Ancylobacter radicis]MBS9477177.1 amidoligase family protein [Ancylobacter radicis]